MSEGRRPEFLAYVQPFKPAPGSIADQKSGDKAHVPDDNIEMFKIIRSLRSDKLASRVNCSFDRHLASRRGGSEVWERMSEGLECP